MIPFSPPFIDDKIINEVIDTLKSGWITTGPKTKLFEKKISEYVNNKATLCLNSATAGLELMLRWYGVKEGDEVILPAYTYAATANVIIHCGAKPVLVDIADDFNININLIKNAITNRTKVIMPVDIGGFPCDYDKIKEILENTETKKMFNPNSEEQKKLGRILLLSDSAHSIGAKYKNGFASEQSDVSVFSFHAVKNLTTAEGGAVCLNLPLPFNNEEIYKELCILSLHGQNKDALAKAQKGSWRYDIVNAGYKMNMTDIQASIGLVELERYETQTLKRRKEIFEKYTSELNKYKWALAPTVKTNEKETSYHVYLLRIKDITEEQRDKIITKIFDKDVSVNVHFQPIPLLSFYKNLGYNINDYANSFKLYSQEISLPVYYTLTDEQIKIVLNAVISSVEEELYA